MIDPNAIQELKVYPPIGLARVGNADGANDYVIGPETIGGAPTLPGSTPEAPARYLHDFRTGDGKIKRQAARFRVYAHMKDGSVREVTASSAKIEWRVVVANLKAGWYEFNQAMDLGPSLSTSALQRNRDLAAAFPTGHASISFRRRKTSPAPTRRPLRSMTVRFGAGRSTSASSAPTPTDI